jgi:hypothetical protein
LFHAGFLLDLFFTLKIDATCSSEKYVDSQQTARRYTEILNAVISSQNFISESESAPVDPSESLDSGK